ncbi:hypothetical protein TNCV_2638231 [Trichonephila clavipes]|nr:hypothetical protein TNCV_2638231 [Trichonephila clavipes]
MGTPTTRNVAPAVSEYAETVRSNHCSRLKFTTWQKQNLPPFDFNLRRTQRQVSSPRRGVVARREVASSGVIHVT